MVADSFKLLFFTKLQKAIASKVFQDFFHILISYLDKTACIWKEIPGDP
jgi:hypothetical protein